MKQILDFLTRLGENNNKVWFDAHKAEYLEAKAKFEEFSLRFLRGVEDFDPRVKNLSLKDITYRIYRDVRFSNDKRPYKWHMGVYVCPKGKKSGMAGYYIHLEPVTDTFFICAGLYNPTKEVQASIREEIMLNGKQFDEALQQCKDFELPWDAALKKMPRGFNEEDEYSRYYRLKSYEIYKTVTKRDVLSKDFLDKALADLRRTHTFNEILNRSFDFAYEN
ncbi:MAG: DUF2461 domain-containing protein [Bacteroidaceae bacterium]|nr:DUF2461 domain-containing protein [Bacteroidaceae bacterium]